MALPPEVPAVLRAQMPFEKAGLPSVLISRLKRLASFQTEPARISWRHKHLRGAIFDLGDDFKVEACDELLAKLERVFGDRVVVLR